MEAVVSLLLGLVLMSLVLTVLGRQREVVVSLGRRSEALAAIRTARVVLRREARALGIGAWEASTDSVRLRAYRGTGTVCPDTRGGTVLVVSPRGVRAADPSKDSVLALTQGGRVLFRALGEVVGVAPCSADTASAWQRWILSDSVPPGVILVRYFERGSYHISGAALRYRRGSAGRQPLTPEALGTPESRFLPFGRSLHALLFPARSGSGSAVELFLGRRAP